jgi:hypothetical protein
MKKNLFFGVLCSIFLVACIREINFEAVNEDTNLLVVDGNFTDQNGPHRIYLTRPNKFDVYNFEIVQGATIFIKDDEGNQAQFYPQYDIDPEHPYYYELFQGPFKGIAGRTYHLEINLLDGKTYQTTPQIMPNRINIDSITVKGRIESKVSSVDLVVEQKNAIISAALTVPNDAKNYFMRWEAHAVYAFFELAGSSPINLATKTCYVLDNFIDQTVPLQALIAKNGQSAQVVIGKKAVDRSFYTSQYVTIVQRSITQEAYRYWEKIQQIATPTGGLFDVPPGTINGNIFNTRDSSERVLGFFEVAAVDTLRHKITNRALGPDFFVGRYCNADGYFQAAAECYDCLLLENSSRNQPWYWEF